VPDFDPLSDNYEDITEDGKQLIIDHQSLIHRVFSQNDDGKKLLELWFDAYLMSSCILDITN